MKTLKKRSLQITIALTVLFSMVVLPFILRADEGVLTQTMATTNRVVRKGAAESSHFLEQAGRSLASTIHDYPKSSVAVALVSGAYVAHKLKIFSRIRDFCLERPVVTIYGSGVLSGIAGTLTYQSGVIGRLYAKILESEFLFPDSVENVTEVTQ